MPPESADAVVEEVEDPVEAILYIGDHRWHGGIGYYYTYAEYEEEGSIGPFVTVEDLISFAVDDNCKIVNLDMPYVLSPEGKIRRWRQ